MTRELREVSGDNENILAKVSIVEKRMRYSFNGPIDSNSVTENEASDDASRCPQ